MLLEFKMKNFKSFKEEMDFKMIPAPKLRELEYSLINKKVNNKEITALSSAAIYGPNSAGKTNIIGGIDVLRSIILTGNIKDKEMGTTLNTAVDKLELIPNIENDENEPVSFYIKFLAENLVIELSLEIRLGKFLQKDYDRIVEKEELRINGKMIYRRSKGLIIENINEIKDYLIENFAKDTAEVIAKSNLDTKELLLNGMFKTLYSKKIFDIIYNWFENDLKIIYRADTVESFPIISPENNKKFFFDKELNKALKEFGLTSDGITYPITDKKEAAEPLSVIHFANEQEGVAISAEVFESFGTVRFLNIFPLILTAIRKGSILVVDELDASIHPMAIMSIIKLFHNDEINKKGAQLIFNTHNPIFLTDSLLRRDEIKFVEREGSSSVHYSLSDFGTSGANSVRKGEDYIKNYFINKYGAIKDIDFSDVFKKD